MVINLGSFFNTKNKREKLDVHTLGIQEAEQNGTVERNRSNETGPTNAEDQRGHFSKILGLKNLNKS